MTENRDTFLVPARPDLSSGIVTLMIIEGVFEIQSFCFGAAARCQGPVEYPDFLAAYESSDFSKTG
jgi:hypothetical protein